MKTKKNRIVLSGISVLLVLSLLVGGTMAWFTDTEQVDANFSAGVLDIIAEPDVEKQATLEFENLRPLTEAQFDEELVQADLSNANQEGFDPAPVYFQPVKVSNNGTLPVYLQITAESAFDKPGFTCPKDGEKDIKLSKDKFTVSWDGKTRVACTNGLEDKLKIFLYAKNSSGKWVRQEGVNLNKASLETGEEATFTPSKEQFLAANESVTYVIGGYLPEDADNTYQGKHFHGNVVVNAYQTDDGAGINPPDEPDTVRNTINVKFKENETAIGEDSYTFTADIDDTQYLLYPADLADITPVGYKVTGLEEVRTRAAGGLVLVIPLENGKLVNDSYKTITAIVEKTGDTPTDVTKEVAVSYQTADNTERGTHTLSITFKSDDVKDIPASDYASEITAHCPSGYVLGDISGLKISVANGEVASGTLVVPVSVEEFIGNVEIDEVVLGKLNKEFPDCEVAHFAVSQEVLEEIKAANGEIVIKMYGDEGIEGPTFTNGYQIASSIQNPVLIFEWRDSKVYLVSDLILEKVTNVSPEKLALMSASSRTLVSTALNVGKAAVSSAAPKAAAYLIYNQASLAKLSEHMDEEVAVVYNFKMTSDWTPLTGTFTGTFEGRDNKITGLNTSSTGTGVGLFSVNGGTIQDLTIENASVTGSKNVGIIAGENTAAGKIVNCKVSGSVTGTFVDSTQLDGEATAAGGIAGLNEGTIEKSRSDANAAGPFGVGSLVGVNTGAVKTSFATGSVNASVSDLDAYYTLNNYYPPKHFGKYQAAGGLVGSNYGGTVENSYAYAPNGTVRGFALVGGLVGDNYNGTVKSSWSSMGNVNVSTRLTYGDGTACTHYAHFCVATDSYNGTVNNTYYTNTSGNTFYYGADGTATGWGEKKDLSTLPAGFSTSVWTITSGQPDLLENPLNGSVAPPPPPEHPQLELDIPAYRIKGTANNINNAGQVTIAPGLFNDVVAANGAAYQEPLTSERITLPAMPDGYQVATSPAQKLNMKWDAVQGKIVVLSAIGVEPTTATPGSNEYSIYTQSDLEAVANKLGASYYLWNDLSIMSNWEPLGWTTSDDVPFTGTFNGQGFAIDNLNADYSGSGSNYYSNVGLFALNEGTIQDLTVNTGSTGVIGGTKVGIIAGQNLGTIQRCHVNGTVAGLYTKTSQDPNCVGGVTGINGANATLMQCSSNAEAYGYAYVASLAGQNWGDIKQCYSTGGVNATNTADQIANSSTIYTYMASLVGGNKGTINNSYAIVPNSTSIRGTYRIGGLVGANFSGGIVKNSYVVCDSAYTVNHPNQTGVGHRCIGYNAGSVSNVFYQSATQSGVNQGVAKTSLMGEVLKNEGFNTSIWGFPANNYPNLKNNKR